VKRGGNPHVAYPRTVIANINFAQNTMKWLKFRKDRDSLDWLTLIVAGLAIALTLVLRMCDRNAEKPDFNINCELENPLYGYGNFNDEVQFYLNNNNFLKNSLNIYKNKGEYNRDSIIPIFIYNTSVLDFTVTSNSKISSSITNIKINSVSVHNDKIKVINKPESNSLFLVDEENGTLMEKPYINFEGRETKGFKVIVSLPLLVPIDEIVSIDSLSRKVTTNGAIRRLRENNTRDILKFNLPNDTIEYLMHRHVYTDIVGNTKFIIDFTLFDNSGRKHKSNKIVLN